MAGPAVAALSADRVLIEAVDRRAASVLARYGIAGVG